MKYYKAYFNEQIPFFGKGYFDKSPIREVSE